MNAVRSRVESPTTFVTGLIFTRFINSAPDEKRNGVNQEPPLICVRSSMGEQCPCKAKVGSSSLPGYTKSRWIIGLDRYPFKVEWRVQFPHGMHKVSR